MLCGTLKLPIMVFLWIWGGSAAWTCSKLMSFDGKLNLNYFTYVQILHDNHNTYIQNQDIT